MAAKDKTPKEGDGANRRLATLLGAVALLGTLVVIAVFIAFDGEETEEPAPAAPPSQSRPTSTPSGAVSNHLNQAPSGVRWEIYQGRAVPYSSEHGPRKVDRYGPATGFARSPEGALVAAANLSTRVRLAPDAVWREVVETHVIAGEGRDKWVSMRSGISIKPGVPASTQLTQLAGFRLLNYTPALAAFEFVSRAPNGSLQSAQVTVAWDGDWKVVLQPDGSTGGAAYPVKDLTGYTAWGGI